MPRGPWSGLDELTDRRGDQPGVRDQAVGRMRTGDQGNQVPKQDSDIESNTFVTTAPKSVVSRACHCRGRRRAVGARPVRWRASQPR
jgi:hypothetical protein